MKKTILWLIIGFFSVTVGFESIQAQPEKVVDNFMQNSPLRRELNNDSKRIRRQGNTADIIGGYRLTDFGSAPIGGGITTRSSLLDISGLENMFVESGVNSSVEVTHNYGNGSRSVPNPLNLQLLGVYDRFRIEFLASDLELNYFVQVFDGNNNNSFLNGTVSTANKNLPFNADFIISDFPTGAPNPVNWNDIDAIVVRFSTGNATGGQDFAVKRIVIRNGE